MNDEDLIAKITFFVDDLHVIDCDVYLINDEALDMTLTRYLAHYGFRPLFEYICTPQELDIVL